MANAMMVIYPYRNQGDWVFDDEAAGLTREPFVFGMPEMIDILVKDIPDAERGFKLYFSARPFPGFAAELSWLREEYEGNWYLWDKTGMEGWLCPALFKYFDQAPTQIYCKAGSWKNSVSEEHRVQFGHADSERLVLSNFKLESETYSLDAEICAGSFRGAVRIFGQGPELDNLHISLLELSETLSGKVEFENLEGQLKIHCSIGSTGTVHFNVAVTDHRNRVECAFDTDAMSLASTVADLATII